MQKSHIVFDLRTVVGVVLGCDCVVFSWLWGRISKLVISLSWLASSELLFLPSLPQPTSSLHRGTIFLVLLCPVHDC